MANFGRSSQMELFIFNAACSIQNSADLAALKPYLYTDPESGIKKFYTHNTAVSNQITRNFSPPEDMELTKGKFKTNSLNFYDQKLFAGHDKEFNK